MKTGEKVTNFDDFWQLYLSHHQIPVNQYLHAIGTVGGIACLVLAASVTWKWALVALPVGYGCAWLGHFLIEGNSPLTFQYPLWSLIADYRLVGYLLTGRATRIAKTPQVD